MTRDYKSLNRYDAPFTDQQCRAAIAQGSWTVSFRQCSRKPWKDGWCKQHHPDTEEERQAQRMVRSRQKQERSLAFLLQLAREEIARLKARIAELEASE